MSDIYLQITETPTVVTLSTPVISGALSSTVTVANVVSVNVVTMPSITVQAASVTTVIGTVTVGNSININSLPAISGTVTVGSALPTGTNRIGVVTIGGGTITIGAGTSQIGSVTISSLPAISGTVTANVVGANDYTSIPLQMAYSDEAFANGNRLAVSLVNSQGEEFSTPFSSDGGGAQPASGIQLGFSTETSAGEDYVRVAPSNPLPVSVGNSVNINSLPAIRINPNYNGQNGNNGPVVEADSSIGYDPRYMVFAGGMELTSNEYRGLTFVSNGLLVAGTVTVGSALPTGTNRIGVVTIGGGTVTIGAGTAQIGSVTASISGTVPISISSVTVGNSVTIGSLPAISGTVTANSSNGSLTTRFGSVTTANTAFATSAVTNANRKYLLIQNITTASNVITVGIGFTPTTTQGILLSSGAGITFEGSYIPTGAVNLLSSVTASCFTILEA